MGSEVTGDPAGQGGVRGELTGDPAGQGDGLSVPHHLGLQVAGDTGRLLGGPRALHRDTVLGWGGNIRS